MYNKLFQRKKEDFVCEQCGFFVSGTGYTNHCENCLWSKHVDVNPGDRLAKCGGLMEPVDVEESSGKQVLTAKCIKCNHVRKNKIQDSDNIDIVLKLSKKISEDKYLCL